MALLTKHYQPKIKNVGKRRYKPIYERSLCYWTSSDKKLIEISEGCCQEELET